MESVNRKIKKLPLVKEFLFHSTCEVRNGNVLKSRVSEICEKRIRVNQGVGVKKKDCQLPKLELFKNYYYSMSNHSSFQFFEQHILFNI